MSTTGDRSNESPHSQPKGEDRRWRRRFRVMSVGTTAAGIAVFGALMLSPAQESSAATAVSPTAVPVWVGSDGAPAPTASMPATMPGMDMSGSSPSPTMDPNMPGMDMSGSSPSPTMDPNMPGMDMSGSSPSPPMDPNMPGMDMSGSSPSPTMDPNMPGMDMSGSSPTPPPPAGMSPDMPGMDMSGGSGGAAVHRPLAPVLGTFGGGTAAVLLTAGMMRRKDRALSLAKKAARLAGRGRK